MTENLFSLSELHRGTQIAEYKWLSRNLTYDSWPLTLETYILAFDRILAPNFLLFVQGFQPLNVEP